MSTSRISRTMRFAILRRDNHACRYCGRSAPDVKLQVDHVIPEALGGPTQPDNLVTACDDCNGGKAATSPDAQVVDDVRQDALRWTRAMQAAIDERAAERATVEERNAKFYRVWHVMRGLPLPRDWARSIEGLRNAGLTDDLIDEAMQAAIKVKNAKDRFAYFCGTAWRMVRQLQERAGEILGHGERSDDIERAPSVDVVEIAVAAALGKVAGDHDPFGIQGMVADEWTLVAAILLDMIGEVIHEFAYATDGEPLAIAERIWTYDWQAIMVDRWSASREGVTP